MFFLSAFLLPPDSQSQRTMFYEENEKQNKKAFHQLCLGLESGLNNLEKP